MIEPRFDDSAPLECGGCAEPTDTTAVVARVTTPICADCLHDSTFVCAQCSERFWSVSGKRFYVSPALYCPDCFRVKDDACHASWQKHLDDAKDVINQVRR